MLEGELAGDPASIAAAGISLLGCCVDGSHGSSWGDVGLSGGSFT